MNDSWRSFVNQIHCIETPGYRPWWRFRYANDAICFHGVFMTAWDAKRAVGWMPHD